MNKIWNIYFLISFITNPWILETTLALDLNGNFHLPSADISESILGQLYPNAKYLDPCKSNSFTGDVALSDEERDTFLRKDVFLSPKPTQIWYTSDALNTTSNNSTLFNVTFFDKHSIQENISKYSPTLLQNTIKNSNLTLREVRKVWRDYYNSLGVDRHERIRLVREKVLLWRKEKYPHLFTSSKNTTLDHDNVPKRRVRRAATAYKSRTWPDGVIPYLILGNFSTNTKATIMKAMRHWENFTCLSFVEREPHHKSYIIFTEKSCGCCSYVGRRSEDEPQAISIGKNCDKRGIVIHELGHVIGFWHEHTRPDRDDHVEILLNNVVEGQDFNFKKMDPGEVNSLGEPYDYSSIMHYAKGTFAKANKDETIRPTNCCPRPVIGQRVKLSKGDVRQTNKLYSCPTCGRTLLEPSGTFASPQLGEQDNPEDYALDMILNTDLDYEANFHYPYLTKENPDDTTPDKMVDEGMQSDPKEKHSPNPSYNARLRSRRIADSVRPNALNGKPIKSKAFLCQWRINAASGETIQLKFTRMDIYGIYPIYDKYAASGVSDKCMQDYIEVRDGYFSGAPLIGRYCGTEIPEMITSTGSRLWIEYRKSINSESLGFVVEYEAICGGELQMESGSINSPSYPEDYQSNKVCIWKIIVPQGYSVALTFHSFKIEKHDTCVYDYVEIRDGLTENSPRLGELLCGMILPAPLKSTNNHMWIKFVSDGSVERSGFTATFEKEFDECKTINHGCAHICENTFGAYRCACHIGYELNADGKRCDDACGGALKGSSGYIQTPSYPNNYPRLKSCIWRITAKPKETIILTFENFDLEGTNAACNYDFLLLFSGPDTNRKKIGTYCGSVTPEPINSESNILTVEFYTDGSVEKQGFRAKWVTDRDECAAGEHDCEQNCINLIGTYKCSCNEGYQLHRNTSCKEEVRSQCRKELKLPHGTFSSPGWPKAYGNYEDCWWKISATPGQRILIEFDGFYLEPHQNCAYDKVIVYDGPTVNNSVIAKSCGPKDLHTLISKGNNMLVTFDSDSSVNNRGFHAKYRTVCGGNLTAEITPQNIYSHAKFGDDPYPPGSSCDWTIKSLDPTKKIRVRVVYFDLEHDGLCSYDYLALFEGFAERDKEVQKFCGDSYPKAGYISKTDIVSLRFSSDANDERKGFNIQYELVQEEESKEVNKSPANSDDSRDFRMDFRPDSRPQSTPRSSSSSLPLLFETKNQEGHIKQSPGFRYKQPLWDARDDSWTYRVPYQSMPRNYYGSVNKAVTSPHSSWTQSHRTYKTLKNAPAPQQQRMRMIPHARTHVPRYQAQRHVPPPQRIPIQIPKGNRYPTYRSSFWRLPNAPSNRALKYNPRPYSGGSYKTSVRQSSLNKIYRPAYHNDGPYRPISYRSYFRAN